MSEQAKVKSVKSRFYTALMYLCVYLIIVSLPYHYFLNENYQYLLITIGKIVLSVVILILFKKDGFTFEKFDLKRVVFFIPLLLLCCSNFGILLFDKSILIEDPNYLTLVNSACFCLVTALAEELIFRGMAVDIIKSKFNKPLTLLISAAVFGAVHLIAGIFSNPLGALIQAGYTFFLGLIVGFAYLYGGSIYLAVFIHFMFNFLNDSLFEVMCNADYNATYFLVNIGVGAVVAIYAGLAMFLFEKKKPEN